VDRAQNKKEIETNPIHLDLMLHLYLSLFGEAPGKRSLVKMA
jgi:hypothetical protein